MQQSQGQTSSGGSRPPLKTLGVTPEGTYSEYSALGGPRPHQVLLEAFLQERGVSGISEIASAARARLSAQEVTMNIQGDPKGDGRTWNIDPIPLVFDQADWAKLEAGLNQRSRLLNALFADIYGEQRLLKQRVLPLELIFGNPHFARESVGQHPVGGFNLHLAAFDLGRHADGNFFVYSDRTAAPAGSGYALENRLALGSALRGLFDDYGVRRLRRYFDRLRSCVAALYPRPADDARVVVLSPGLNDESAFEHAYLTHYLGYELAEGRDLTVRDRHVYLKTLAGLKHVDVVIRRVHDQWCDPLAMREDSFMGVAGLAEAANAGNVTLINPLGAAVVETPALKMYSTAICRALLGEEPLLSTVDTYWGGDPQALRYMLDHFDELIFKPAFKEYIGERHPPGRMPKEQRDKLLERVKATPGRFIAERWCPLSVTPIFSKSQISYESVSFRSFVCLRGGEYVIMPGGLGRVDATPDGIFVCPTDRGLTKDVWVLSSQDEAGEPILLTRNERVTLRRGGQEVPSRLLDDHYWLGRYVERGDVSARVLRAGLERLSSEAEDDAPAALQRIRATLRAMEVLPPQESRVTLREEDALLGAIFNLNHKNSLARQMRGVHELARRTRSRLSRDTWNILHRVSTLFDVRPQPQRVGDVLALLDRLLILLSAMRGITLDSMVRSDTWTFLDMGRQVERATQTLTILSEMLKPDTEHTHMAATLEIADSLLTYRSRYLSTLQIGPVVDLLLTDDTNPRSLAYQTTKLRKHVASLPRADKGLRSSAEKHIIKLQSALLTADVFELVAGDGAALRAIIETADDLLWQFSDEVSRTWFSHASGSHPISPPHWVNENLEAGE